MMCTIAERQAASRARRVANATYEKKKPVVTPPDAVVQPDAVVVLRFDAGVADAAVVGAGRAPDGAGFAVFSRDLHGLRGGTGGWGGVAGFSGGSGVSVGGWRRGRFSPSPTLWLGGRR